MRWKRAASLLAFVVLLLAGVLALLALPKGHQSLGKVPVALAVDQRTARAFVANYGSDTVSILDATTGLVQRTQPVAGHPLAIAVDVRDARVVVASEGPPGQPGTLTVLDAADGSLLSTTRVGIGPAAVVADTTTRHAFVLNLDGASLSTVEIGTGRTLRTTPVRLIDPHFVEHPACAGIAPLNVCYSNATAGRLIQYNGEAWYVVHQSPAGLVVDERRHHLFVVATMNNTVDEFDTRTGILLRTIPVGLAPCAIALDPRTGQAFVSNLDSDSVSVLDTVRGVTLRTIAVGRAPSSLVLDAHGGRIVTANQQDGTVSIVDIRHPGAARTVPMGYGPTALAMDWRAHRVLVATMSADSGVGSYPRGLASLRVLDLLTGKMLHTTSIGRDPIAIAVDDGTGRILVLHIERSVPEPDAGGGWWGWLQRWLPFLARPQQPRATDVGDVEVYQRMP